MCTTEEESVLFFSTSMNYVLTHSHTLWLNYGKSRRDQVLQERELFLKEGHNCACLKPLKSSKSIFTLPSFFDKHKRSNTIFITTLRTTEMLEWL